MIKVILFDVDNTLLDFDAYVQETMRSGFAKFDLGTYRDEMYQTFTKINTKLWQDIEQERLTYEELLQVRWNTIFKALNISCDGVEFEKYFKHCLFDSAIPVEGAADILAYLKDRYILGVASNGPHDQQLNRLKKAGMLSCFSEVFTSGKIGVSKPSLDFFKYCMDALNAFEKNDHNTEISPSEVMMIGDSLTSDMTGAINYGMKTCFFDKAKKEQGRDLAIDHRIFNLCEIKEIL